MISGVYTLNLECDCLGCTKTARLNESARETINDQTREEAMKKARAKGWRIYPQQGKCIAPEHRPPGSASF